MPPTSKRPAPPAPGKALAKAPELKAARKIVQALSIEGPVIIKSAAQYIEAAETLKAIKGAARDVTALKSKVLTPAKETVKQITALFAEDLAQLADAEVRYKAEIARYEEAQRLLQLAEQRKVDEAADRQRAKIAAQIETAQIAARNEAKGLRRDAAAAAKAGDKARAATLREKATALEAKAEAKIERLSDKVANVVAPIIQREAPKVEGLSSRKVWRFEVTDPAKVNRAFMMPDLEKIDTHVQALGPDAAAAVGAGVRIFQDTIIASTAEAA